MTVSEEAPVVNTTNDVLGGTFSNKAINELPLLGRDQECNARRVEVFCR